MSRKPNDGYGPAMADGPEPLIAGQYRLVEEIGRGGFGVVWRARDERLRRDVAAKELFLPGYLAADQRRERRERSLREARSAARIVHPSAVTVYDVVEHDGCPWIIMELVAGRALSAVVRRHGPVPPRRAAEIGLAVLGALQSAHAAGVVHRDVKPANVLISDSRIVLTDFGIATIEGDPVLTNSGLVMGAPSYTAPERARGELAVPASDLWSLGATLFYAVEGKRPYAGANANAVFHAIVTGEPPVAWHAGRLAPVIAGLLRKDPRERMTADTAARLLREIIDAPPDSAVPDQAQRPATRRRHRRWPGVLAGIAAALVLAVVLVALVWPDPRPRQAETRKRQAAASPLLATLTGSPDGLSAVAFSRDGRTVATGGADGVVRLWDVPGRRQTRQLRASPYDLFAVAFSPDGRTLASAGYDRTVVLWDVTAGHRIKALPGRADAVSALAFSPDGRMLASSGADGVTLWRLGRGRPVRHLSEDGNALPVVAFGGRGLIVAGSRDLRLWPADGRSPATRLGGTGATIGAMALDPPGNVVACGGLDGLVRYWDTRTRKRLGTLAHGYSVHSLAISSDGRTLATAARDEITLWTLPAGRKTAVLHGHTDLVYALAFSPGGHILASASHDKTLRLWQTP